MASTPAGKRPTPFTPRTTRSTATAVARDMSSRLAAAPTPVLLSSTHKKYKAPLSIESRTRKGSTLPSVPGSPSKSRPTSRAGSRMGTASPALTPLFPQQDVEQSVVDFQSVGIDLTGDEHGGDVVVPIPEVSVDKVMVSVRVRPPAGNTPTAWTVTHGDNTIHLSGTPTAPAVPSPANKFTFDAIHTIQPTAPLYATAARPQVHAFMSGYNAVVFAYGQTASGKTYTLSGSDEQPGIIPRAIREIFAFIRATPSREYLLRCSYLEIYNETIHDLLAPSLGAGQAKGVEIQGGGAGGEVILSGLREEVVTSLASVREVLRRGEGNRRTASTDWNERSSRSHSVFRVVCESRERSNGEEDRSATPTTNGRHTPGLGGRQTPGAGGPRLQAKGGRSVQTSVLSLIDLAGSEKATSDKERTKEGRYINTSLLTLGTVISTLAENAAKGKSDHVPYRNSKLTRMLQPSLSGNARVSVVCTINPDASAVSESMSTLQFARRIKGVQLNAQKKEIVDTDALIERYRKEIEDLKRRLEEREQEAPVRKRRLSAREQIDESKAMGDLNSRIKQLTKLILTSQSVGSGEGDEERPASPVKIDFDMSPYQLQQELLTAKLQIESQANQILSLEATLLAQPEAAAFSSSGDDGEKDRVIAEQGRVIRELEDVVRAHEADDTNANAQVIREEVEREWQAKLDAERRVVAEKEAWAVELVRQLEKEKKMRIQLEEERRALAAFVSKFDSLGLGLLSAASSPVKVMPSPGGASAAFNTRREARQQQQMQNAGETVTSRDSSPIRMSLDLSMTGKLGAHPSLLEQMPEEEWAEVSFDADLGGWGGQGKSLGQIASGKGMGSPSVFGLSSKENVPA
ncbi:P-loop containing nucleoside triphosphate hydrolase protein [Mycena metata]|uniref:Kinesin-like protein n=1 Tax=Mycena metata TaxID=1033252 RepID=A0AAD7KH22_9AGAR|nr:P-loop containing nucleoside triphosphate hydrolase protein [Mycena metata]